MCGLTGSVGSSLPFDRVRGLLSHRGPDEQTQWKDDLVHFIHTRLAIQELSTAGRQPMQLGNTRIIFNGEIYNHLELRQRHGLSCASHSDTETLLHLFRKLGTRMFDELDGMFAIAIYDAAQRKVWLVRDRAGEKPLYYTRVDGTLIFASELRVIHALTRPAVDDQLIANYLAVGYLPPDQTPYQNVHELPPGHYLEVEVTAGNAVMRRWWDIAPAFENRQSLSEGVARERVDELLRISVNRRLVSSDLEVGTFLSGGIDSGLVTALAAEKTARLKTFTVSFEGTYDEAPLARKVAEHLGTNHQEITLSFANLENDLERIFDNYGEPMMDDSIIPSYYVASAAKQHLTVILNGDAGDELFGGYRRYVPFASFPLFRSSTGLVNTLFSFLPRPSDKMNYYNYFYRLVKLAATDKRQTYFAATNDLLHDRPDVFAIKPNLDRYFETIDVILARPLTGLQKLMCLDFTFLLPAVLLVKIDIATMAHSLEGRSPFLSRELLDFVPGLGDNVKIRGRKTKFLLRTLAARYLPADVVDQPKRGFEVPLRQWVDSRLRRIIFDYLVPSTAYVRTIVDPRYVDAMLDGKADVAPEQRARILFSWLALERWKRQYG